MTQNQQLVSWLNSAYAMEQSLAHVLKNHAADAKEHPELSARISAHVEETHEHGRQIEACLQLLGEKPPVLKTAMGNIMGMVQGASTGMFRDELVKNALADYAAEHFEIACYRSLIAASEAAGQTQIADICREILEDEEAMAEWLEEQIPAVTHLVLQETATT